MREFVPLITFLVGFFVGATAHRRCIRVIEKQLNILQEALEYAYRIADSEIKTHIREFLKRHRQ